MYLQKFSIHDRLFSYKFHGGAAELHEQFHHFLAVGGVDVSFFIVIGWR